MIQTNRKEGAQNLWDTLLFCSVQANSLILCWLFFLTVGYDVVQVAVCPTEKLVKNRHERFAAFGERVFHAWRCLGIGLALYQAVYLKGTQGLYKHFLCNVGVLFFYLLISDRGSGLVERVEHGEAPLAAHAHQDVANGAFGEKWVADKIILHGYSAILSIILPPAVPSSRWRWAWAIWSRVKTRAYCGWMRWLSIKENRPSMAT